jgi:hypothetical protein
VKESDPEATESEIGADTQEHKTDDWNLWPPSPKMQIVMIAAIFGLFNFCLLAIWAWVMIDQFG